MALMFFLHGLYSCQSIRKRSFCRSIASRLTRFVKGDTNHYARSFRLYVVGPKEIESATRVPLWVYRHESYR